MNEPIEANERTSNRPPEDERRDNRQAEREILAWLNGDDASLPPRFRGAPEGT